MEKPKFLRNCPFCGKHNCLILIKENFKHVAKKNLYTGWFWKYKCVLCENCFTTTESDEISLKYLKQRKL